MESLNVNVVEQKMRIVSYIKISGPVVGQNIAKKMGLQIFLASALLSELLKEKAIKSSYLRVGGSPLYFVSGQEERLNNYTKFLAFKEREAYKMLNGKKVLEDVKLDPPIRVAFRNMKDFAIPLSVSIDGAERLFWKFHTLSREEAQSIIKDLLKKAPKPKTKIEKSKLEVVKTNVESKQNLTLETKEKEERTLELTPEVKPKKKSKSNLPLKVQEWMTKESVIMKEDLGVEGKMLKAVVEVKSNIGSLNFLLIAIDKKSVNEGELALCYQEGIDKKLPVLLLMNGKPSKKGQKILEGFKGHVTMRKL